MKIAILGTRGVPNYYGGFEQFAEFFSVYLVQQGHEVYCYNSHDHPFQEKTFHGVNIIHKYDPEYKTTLKLDFSGNNLQIGGGWLNELMPKDPSSVK